ncbi:hypothetical protein, conserved [Babesia bigemina]|uniref:Uncharacterized protein n=1 Tax=Babesia bigemina TaxID=5866 RepID=A0A061D9S9_BABBI|nr:hypothetical protein, conserved [Babesia bigemina]CDR94490.1 hypothetical protein, conserved [Babesia bigemina]|eukprot:XP_012766676.1 hypothetical protein, conserved [Babesia bigemina]
MSCKKFMVFLGSSAFLGYAFVTYRLKLTRREALKRFEESEDGRRLAMESLSFAPKIQTEGPDVSQKLIEEYKARQQPPIIK